MFRCFAMYCSGIVKLCNVCKYECNEVEWTVCTIMYVFVCIYMHCDVMFFVCMVYMYMLYLLCCVLIILCNLKIL